MLQGHGAKGYRVRRKKRLSSPLVLFGHPWSSNGGQFHCILRQLVAPGFSLVAPGFFPVTHSLVCFLGLDLFALGISVSSSGTGTQSANACVTNGYVMAVEKDGLG